MRNKYYQSLGIGLFSSLLFVTPQVLADENITNNATSTSTKLPTIQTDEVATTTTTDNTNLNLAISRATAEGIITVETETETFETFKEAQNNYNQQVELITEVTQNYSEAKLEYQKAELDYKNYQREVSNYQDQLVKYQEYQRQKQRYQVELKTYNLAKARYDEDYQEALGNINKIGYLPEVLAQNLIFRSEPNATQSFTGNIIPNNILQNVVKNNKGWMDPGTVPITLNKQTVTTKGKWNSALMSIGDSVVVDYSDLENSSFSGYKLKKVRYTYKLISTTHYSGKVIFQAIADPTVTSYTHIYNKDGKTQSSFEMEMTVQFFDENGNELIPSPNNYVLTSFASINSLKGEGEFVGHYNGTFIPINGSTISVQNGYALNFSDILQGSIVSDWDSETSPDAYIGAIVGKSTQRIQFRFGNSNGFADWFAFNSDIKVKGGILTPPIPPIAPIFMAKPIRPIEVKEPQAILTPIILYHQNKVISKPKPTSPKNNVTPKKVTSNPSNHTIAVVYTYAKPASSRSININYNTQIYTSSSTTEKTRLNTKIPKTTKSNPSSKKDWFGINTGITNSPEKGLYQSDLITYIKQIGEKAKKKYGNNQAAINRDIALTLASPSYSRDFLQNLYNTFKKSTYSVPKTVKKTIVNNHLEGKIDLSHVMTTLASLENQKFSDETIKYIASRSLVTPSFLGSNPIFELITNLNKRNNILQQNSIVGDLFTTMPESDLLTDMDAIILAKHPKYKNLPLDERILKYYNQEDLKNKRKNLFLEVYQKNSGKNKGAAQLSSFIEILGGIFTFGGIGALAYSIRKDKLKDIGKNIKQLDTVLYDGNIDKFIKQPFKTTGKFLTTTFDKKIIAPVSNGGKKVKTIIQQKFPRTVKIVKNIASIPKKIVTVTKKAIKTIRSAPKKIVAKAKRVIKTIRSAPKKIVAKAKRVIKTIRSAPRRIVAKAKRVVKTIRSAPKRIVARAKRVVKAIHKIVLPKKKKQQKAQEIIKMQQRKKKWLLVLILLSTTLIILLSGLSYIRHNLLTYQVYYIKHMPHAKGTNPQMALLIDQLAYMKEPQLKGIRFDDDGFNAIIKNDTLYLGNPPSDDTTEYQLSFFNNNASYGFSKTGSFVYYSFYNPKLKKYVYDHSELQQKEAEQYVNEVITPIINKLYQKPKVNLQWIFNQKYETRFSKN